MKVSSLKAEEVAEELGLLTAHQVCREAGISYRMLDHYVTKGFLAPADSVHNPGSGYARLFRPDIVIEIVDLRQRVEACPFHPHGERF